MLNVDIIRGTKVYQEAFEEGKQAGKAKAQIKIIAKLLPKGMSVQEVAELLEIDEETVRKSAP